MSLITKLLRTLDAKAIESTRLLAKTTSRRSFLSKLGITLVGAGAIPVLPVMRQAAADSTGDFPEMGDPQSCDYWRYCAFGGHLCTCCGGTESSCPPGTEMSSVSWIGTCRNPADGKHYVISYDDCCGKEPCGRCFCHRTEGDKPLYYPQKSNNILWCFGTQSHSYHCTVARVLGESSVKG